MYDIARGYTFFYYTGYLHITILSTFSVYCLFFESSYDVSDYCHADTLFAYYASCLPMVEYSFFLPSPLYPIERVAAWCIFCWQRIFWARGASYFVGCFENTGVGGKGFDLSSKRPTGLFFFIYPLFASRRSLREKQKREGFGFFMGG